MKEKLKISRCVLQRSSPERKMHDSPRAKDDQSSSMLVWHLQSDTK